MVYACELEAYKHHFAYAPGYLLMLHMDCLVRLHKLIRILP